MTSHHRRDNDHHMFTSKTPHFFKVILDETLRDGKLAISKHFVRKYGKRLPSSVYLEVPSAEVWQVELTKCDGRVWLQNGWQEFAEHYSLKYGHFVVFRYEGNAHFHVLIFDMKATEIEYPYTSTDEDDTLECKKRKEKSAVSGLQLHKKMKVDSPNETGIKMKSKILAPATKGRGGTCHRSPQVEFLKRVRSLTANEKSKALQKASGFRTINPFFMVVMQPSFISSAYRLNIPVSFARTHFKMSHAHGRNVKLWISNGQSWPARYYCMTNRDGPQLRGAWKAFAQHNALQVGDVCVFELIKMSPEIMLKVVIFPVVKYANASRSLAKDNDQGLSGTQKRGLKPTVLRRMQPLTPNEKTRVLKPSTADKSANPSFTVAMQPSYLSGASLNIPYPFAKSYFGENGVVTLRVSDGRTWTVDYRRKASNTYKKANFLGKSWRPFAMDNNLKVGDVCVFKLIKANRMLLDVVIFPAADDISSCSSSELEDAECDDSIEILEDIAPREKMRERSPIPCPRPAKVTKTNMTNRAEKMLNSSECLSPRFRPNGIKARETKFENLKGSTCSSSSKPGDGLKPRNGTGRGMGNGWEYSAQAVILSFRSMTTEEKLKCLRIANSFNSKNPFFLSLIQPWNTSVNNMSIPDKFVKKFLSKTPGGEAILCLPDGKSWSVEYHRRSYHENPRARFTTGWKKFALDNRLVVGDICVFELLEGAEITILKVVIYRVADVANCDTSHEEAEDDDFIEILEDTAPCKKRRERSPILCPRPPKMTKTNMTNRTERTLNSECLAPRFRPFSIKAKETKLEILRGSTSSSSSKKGDELKPCKGTGRGIENGWEWPAQPLILSFQRMTAEEKAKSLLIVNSFNSKNPYFLSVVQPCNAGGKYMSIPNNFAKEFLTKTSGGKAILCLPDGKSWSVGYRRYRAFHENNPKARISTGWYKFAQDNRLVVGDICVFELLERAETTLKVVIHRVADVANCDTSQDGLAPGFPRRHSCASSRAPEAASVRFASNIPLFRKVIKPSFLTKHGHVSLPFEFIEQHFKPDTQNVILQVADRLWSTKLTVSKVYRIGQLSTGGWMKFARENSLKVGDVCVFKLITSSDDAMLDVSISRRDG